MNVLIWFLIISAAAVIFMISYKYYEITTGKSFISEKLRTRFNSLFFKTSIVFRDKIKKIFLSVKSHIDVWPSRFYDFLHGYWKIFSVKVNNHFDRLRKRRYLDKN